MNGYDVTRTHALYAAQERRLARMTGVVAVGAGNTLPLSGDSSIMKVSAEGYGGQDGEDVTGVLYSVDPGYFTALRMPLKLGRYLSERDGQGAPMVAVIDETTAEYFFRGRNPVGRRIGCGDDKAAPDTEVVGVVARMKHASPTEKRPLRIIFLPAAQGNFPYDFEFLVRTSGDPLQLAPLVRGTLAELAPGLPVARLSTLERQRDESLLEERLVALLSGSFAGLAVVSAGLELYGMLAYGVAPRQREMGIRLALGAEGGHLPGLVIKEVLALVLIGVAAGLACGVAAGHAWPSRRSTG